MKHILLENPNYSGFEYGSLKSFEESIIRSLKAEKISYPDLNYLTQTINKKILPGTNKDFLRSYIPKHEINIDGDVLWIILMGPEDFQLDIYKGWKNKNMLKIVYLFDTLPHQFKLIKKLFSNNDIDILITSFNDAIPYLEKETQRKWHYIPQGVPDFFYEPDTNKVRSIAFSSYGRKNESVHGVIKNFCTHHKLYYDYSMSKGIQKDIHPIEAYKQYAWHLKNSIFNISWPVELTNPKRANYLNPITVRWFENATAGVATIGKSPSNILFNDELYEDMVIHLNPNFFE